MMEVTDDNFKEVVIDRKGLAVVDFWAEWCGPCKMFGPIFEEAAEAFKDVQFAKMDVDTNGDTAQKHEVRSIPTIILYMDGVEVDRFTGVLSKEDFIHKIQEQLK
jgi:thioredoxin 1